ncbi:MAG TPA: type II secretion system protein GspJ, partial [Nitrospiria bacterium]|nr:type II secretion system protein GspJ [Nitrospiria bacterium]
WYHLVHEEYPNFLSGEPSEKEVLVEKVKELSFSYFDGKNWLTHWEGGKGAPAPLPLAVRARLVVINGSGEPEEWTHQVNLWEITPR